jgi:HAD superfamily hydrolase (TIGR01549 family)
VAVLLCDLDDTLFDHDRATRDSLADLQRRHQILTCWTLDELDERHRVLLETLHLDVLAGRMVIDDARRERFARLLAQAGAAEDASIAEEVASNYRRTYAANWHPVSGAIELLRTVRADGHRIVVVTNNNVAEQQLKLDRCHIGACIDLMVTSEEAGLTKPDPGIFEQRWGS